MKFFLSAAIAAAIFAATVLLNLSPLRADETKWVSYEPAVVTLTGVIIEEEYDSDATPMDRGKHAWILRLDHPVSVKGKPNDEIDTEETSVSEVHLNLDPSKHRIAKDAFGNIQFAVTGTLYHAHTGHHLRPIVMLVSELKAAVANESTQKKRIQK